MDRDRSRKIHDNARHRGRNGRYDIVPCGSGKPTDLSTVEVGFDAVKRVDIIGNPRPIYLKIEVAQERGPISVRIEIDRLPQIDRVARPCAVEIDVYKLC